jgi:hypothetical protein
MTISLRAIHQTVSDAVARATGQPSPGFTGRRPGDAVEAVISFSGDMFGRVLVTMPRAQLIPLFGRDLPGERGAELELEDAFARCARTICQYLLKSMHPRDQFELSRAVIGPARRLDPSEVVVKLRDGWVGVWFREAPTSTTIDTEEDPRRVVSQPPTAYVQALTPE